MKKLLGLLALALAGTACQQQAPTTQAAAQAPTLPVRAVSQTTVAAPAGQLTLPTALTPAMRSLLQQCNLAALLQTVHSAGDSTMQSHAQNGFFGPTHHRIEVALTSVRRDASRPERYYLAGKTRYKKIITPFSGTLTMRQLLDQPAYTKQELAEDARASGSQPKLYTAVGDFVLREDSTHKNSGVFRGQLALDWSLAADGTLSQDSRTNRTLTQGGGTKYEGTWTQYGSSSPKAVVWVDILLGYDQHLLTDFYFGDRGQEFNPKYAKLGWDEFYENDEWWADAPQPATASL